MLQLAINIYKYTKYEPKLANRYRVMTPDRKIAYISRVTRGHNSTTAFGMHHLSITIYNPIKFQPDLTTTCSTDYPENVLERQIQ